MKLRVEQTYPCDVETFWEMYWDSNFETLLEEKSDNKRELIREEELGEVTLRHMRFTPNRTLPRPVAKILGSDKLIYEQENHWHRGENRIDWKVLPTLLPGKLKSEGTFEVTALGENECRLVVQGEIQVKVALIGGKIEKAVIDQVEQAYVNIRKCADIWLAEHK